eukprot:5764255-Prymnesium_polylepis.2
MVGQLSGEVRRTLETTLASTTYQVADLLSGGWAGRSRQAARDLLAARPSGTETPSAVELAAALGAGMKNAETTAELSKAGCNLGMLMKGWVEDHVEAQAGSRSQ